MHAALRIPELARQVVEACAPGYKDSGPDEPLPDCDLRTVSALTQTCPELAQPAFDVLWYHQVGFNNLVHLMPDDFWRFVDREGPEDANVRRALGAGGLHAHFAAWANAMAHHRWFHEERDRYELYQEAYSTYHEDDVTPQTFARYFSYAERVRKFEMCRYSPGYLEITVEAYRRLVELAGRSLLPNVRTMVWSSSSGPDYRLYYIKAFVTPTLTDITLVRSEVPTDDFLVGLESLVPCCPNLQKLTLDMPTGPMDNTKLASIIKQWAAMREVDIALRVTDAHYPVGSQLLSTLSAVPHLCQLTIDSDYPYARNSVDGPISFADIDSLKIEGTNTSLLGTLLRDCQFPALRQLHVHSSPLVLDGLAVTMQSLVSPHVLSSLIVDAAPGPWDYARTSRLIQFADLSPLGTFHNLEHLIINLKDHRQVGSHADSQGSVRGAQVAFQLTDADWAALARAWPRLRTLNVVGTRRAESVHGAVLPTYRAMAHLARACPALTDIGLVIAGPGAVGGDAALPSCARAVVLRFYHSKVRHVGAMASWIGRVFPRVEAIYAACVVASEDRDEEEDGSEVDDDGGDEEGPEGRQAEDVLWTDLMRRIRARQA